MNLKLSLNSYNVFRSDHDFHTTRLFQGGRLLLGIRSNFQTEAIDLSTINLICAMIDIVGAKIFVNYSVTYIK